ncbi:ABC multidrug transporter, putative [Aspergillus lentulus]|uniref:ABC multidrug transporter, putative n=1 Tax=Aspergillus lentulus TaxID=293939 RepID=A0ABQ0ZUC9_ASPLE|nr:ABC multidrug transporter, putative [Aspergillus lentulus]
MTLPDLLGLEIRHAPLADGEERPDAAPDKKIIHEDADHRLNSAMARAFSNAHYSQDNGHPPRVARVAFKSLNVFGYGSPVDYQTSVGTGLLEVPTIKWQALGRGKQRVDILRDTEGLVLPGNTCMSLVPGLQLLNVSQNHCGRESRLNIDSAAYINYHGINPRPMSTAFRGEAIRLVDPGDDLGFFLPRLP